jgi:uncharacterized membrane protein (UPF0127 family)
MHPRLARLPARTTESRTVILEATTFRARLLGLAGLRSEDLPPRHALLLRPCASVHTFGMRFPIDIAFADEDSRVLHVARGVGAGKVVGCAGAAMVLEFRADRDSLTPYIRVGEGWRAIHPTRTAGVSMFKKLRVRITYANVMATVAVVAALGGGAYAALAAIPGSNGVIHACFKKKKGNLRVVNKPKCKKKERALTWNQTGPQGIQGVRGLQGVPGPTASTSAENPVGSGGEFALTSTDASVIDLFTVDGSGGDQRIQTTFSSRIIVTAHVTLVRDSGTPDVQCHLQISDSTGPTNGLSDITAPSESTFPSASGYSNTITLTGAALRPAGTYNVRMVCKEAAGEAKVSSGSMTVIATQVPETAPEAK